MGIFDFAFGDIKEAYSDVSGFFNDIFGGDSILKDVAGVAKDLLKDDEGSKESSFSIPDIKVDTAGLNAAELSGAMSSSTVDEYIKANAGAESVDAADIEQQWLERIKEMTMGTTNA